MKAENERIRKAFPGAVNNKVEERTRALATEKQEIEAERDRALAQNRSLGMERDKAVRQLQEQKTGEQHRISMAVIRATEEKDKTIRLLQGALKSSRDILNLLADILYKASEIFRRAVDAIIHFGTEQHKSIFAPSEAADIKSVMQEYGETTDQQKAVGHGCVVMRNTGGPLMKSNIATHSMRWAMWQRVSMIGRLREDKITE